MKPPAAATPPAWAVAFAFAVIYISWGTTYLATRTAVADEHMPPALFGGVRLGCAGGLLLAFQLVRGQSLRIDGRTFARLFIVSCFLFLGANWFITVAQTRVPSSVAAVLVATTPLWMGLFAMLWPGGERLHARGWLGLLVGLAGVGLLFAPRVAVSAEAVDTPYLLLVLASSASWAVGSLVLRHHPVPISHLTSAGYQMFFGGVSQIVLGLSLGEIDVLPDHLTAVTVTAFLYLLVVGSLSGFVAFNWLLGHVSVAKVGTYAYVNPAIAVLVGWCAGEAVTLVLLSGIAVILFGVYLVRADKTPPVVTESVE
jgi:drug/metabolite transporter (DMT)-like permease